MTILQSLKSLSGYPIPLSTLRDASESAGLEHGQELTADIRDSDAFKKAKAMVYTFLSTAPNVSQGGISYSFSAEERRLFKTMAGTLLEGIVNGEPSFVVEYGYKGEDL